MLRSRRELACSAITRCRNCRCDKPSRSARAKAASNASSVSGMLSVAKSARSCSRRSGLVGRVERAIVGTLLIKQRLIVSGGTRTDRIVVQERLQMFTLLLGQRFQDGLGPGLHGQDAFDRVERVGAVTHGTLQRGDQIGTGIGAEQGQHLVSVILAVTLCAHQAVKEATRVDS